jgi:hypothetical protein
VRVPIPVVIPLVLAVVWGVWWSNTRHMDFLTPPSAEKLEIVRARVESSLPRVDQPEDSISAPPVVKEPDPPPPPVEEPELDLGDLTTPPTLQNYGELAPQGSAYLIELATGLEKKGEFQRALLAWERVIDLTKPDDSQAITAISSIKRLRPTLPNWNAKPEGQIQVTLHAGAGTTLAKTLPPVLAEVTRDLEAASSGIVKFTATVTAGKTSSSSAKGPPPVAVWLAGPGKQFTSTEVLSFTVDSPDALRENILKNIFLLVRGYLSQSTAYNPPAELAGGENPLSALNFRVTRLCWSEFAAALNVPVKKAK